MQNIAILGKVAEQVGKSAVTKAAHAATTLISQAKENATSFTSDAQAADAFLKRNGTTVDAETAWTNCSPHETEDLNASLDPRDEIISEEDYKKVVEHLDYYQLPPRGENDSARAMWKVPRRFSVRLDNFKIENCTEASYSSVFLVLTVGGNLTEVRLKNPLTQSTMPRMAGYSGETFCTPNAKLPQGDLVNIVFEAITEWRGSYLHLERENFTLELWEDHDFSLNKLLASYQEPLRSVANTSVTKTISLEQYSDGHHKMIKADGYFRISFQFEFQEVYDYELTFCNLKLSKLSEEHVPESEVSHDVKESNRQTQPLLNMDSRAYTLNLHNDQQFSTVDDEVPIVTNQESSMLLWKGYQGPPKVTLILQAGGYNSWPLKVSALLDQNGQGFNASLICRTLRRFLRQNICRARDVKYDIEKQLNVEQGTATTLETTDVCLMIADSLHPRAAGKAKYQANFHLGDTTHSSCIPFQLYSNKTIVANGKITCGIPFRPKYRQTGQILNIDDKQTYIFIKVIKIDRLYPTSLDLNVDSFVEVTYNGINKYSHPVHNSLQPFYQSELIFKTDLHKQTWTSDQEFQAMDSIFFDVWATAPVGYQHLGWTRIALNEFMSSTMGQEQTHHHFDRRKNKQVTYTSKVYSIKQVLNLPYGFQEQNRPSTLFLKIWTKPELNIPSVSGHPSLIVKKSPMIPPDLRAHLDPFLNKWETTFQTITSGSCFLSCLASDQRKRLLPYNAFVYPLKLPSVHQNNSFACFNFDSNDLLNMAHWRAFFFHYKYEDSVYWVCTIRTIAYTETNMYSTSYNLWCSPDFILKSRCGKPMHHALLLASLFLGIGLQTFVCLGSRHYDNDDYAWILTCELRRKESRILEVYRLWDPLIMTVYALPSDLVVHLPKDPNGIEDYLKNQTPVSSDIGASNVVKFSPSSSPRSYENKTRKRNSIENSNQPVSQNSSSPDLSSLTLEEMHCLYGIASHASHHHPIGDIVHAITFVDVTLNNLPFTTLRVVFNENNIYGCLTPTTHCINLDLRNENLWYPFYSTTSLPRNHIYFPPPSISSFSAFTTKESISTLYDDIIKGIQALRFRLSPIITTVWSRQRCLQLFLEEGLEYIADLDNSDPLSEISNTLKQKLNEWRLTLLALTPDHHKQRWTYITFHHMNSNRIVEYLWKFIPFFKETDNSLQFSLGIHTKRMPYEFSLTYIIILALTKLRRVQQKQLSLVDKLYKT